MDNPFTLSFGRKPYQYISRLNLSGRVVETFKSPHPSSQVYMLTGVRGSGKTVLMTEIVKQFEGSDDWITLELNPESDILEDLASKLYMNPACRTLFIKAKLDLSVFGFGLSIEKGKELTNMETAVDMMLKELQKHGKKLLISIDEVTNSRSIRVFASAFQIYMRKDYDVFLIMTGLYENLYNLQNENTMTFLYRVPKVMLEPLNMNAIIRSYGDIFDITDREAADMAVATKGYAFAYQVLGYIKWENKERPLEELFSRYDEYLEEFVYDKIWSELSDNDMRVVAAIAGDDEMRVKELLHRINMSSSLFSTYRDRLVKKGLIDTSRYGYVRLSLPRFSEFADKRMLYE